MAPETALGMDAVDNRSDLYALGIILYELLTGKHPFDAKDPSELFHCHKTVMPPPFRDRAPERKVPPALEAITMRLLEKSPTHRYPSAEALAAALDAVLAPEIALTADSTFDGGALSVTTDGPRAAESRVSSFATPPPLSTSALQTVETPHFPQKKRPYCLFAVALVALIGAMAFGAQRGPTRAPALTARAGPRIVEVSERGVKGVQAMAAEKARQASKARQRLHEAAESKKWSLGGDALLELAELSRGAQPPPTLEPRDVAPAATVTLGLAFSENTRAEPVLQALANDFGTLGIDVLYEIRASTAALGRRTGPTICSTRLRCEAARPLRSASPSSSARRNATTNRLSSSVRAAKVTSVRSCSSSGSAARTARRRAAATRRARRYAAASAP